MFKNNFKIALRNLFKRKGYSFLNIFGLAIGITCCLLIFQYVAYERSYDRFQRDSNRIVRIRLDNYQKGKLAWQSATAYPAIPAAMKKDFPEVEDFCRLKDDDLLLSNDDRGVKFNEKQGYFADPSVIQMFDVKLMRGNPTTALNGPDKMMLSESMAKRYFGNEDPIGKRLTVRDNDVRNYEVTGVYKDYPANSHLVLNYLVSYATLNKDVREQGDTTNAAETSWGWYDYYDYIKLKPGTDWKQLEKKLTAFSDRYMNNDEWRKTNNVKAELYLIPLDDIHLNSNYNQEAEVNGDGKAVGFLFMIAFFIIAIAWVNYTNLATARSLERAKEVGVRKVMGALRRDLIGQFLTESFLLNFIAFLFAFLAVFILTKPFNNLIGTTAPQTFTLPGNYWLQFLGIFIFGALISGIYPAFVLSGYHPVVVLKGLFKNTVKGQILRKGLIIGQFAVSVILIAGTIIVFEQVQYMRQQKLGVNINQTLVLQGTHHSPRDTTYQSIFQPFKNELLQQSNIKSVTASSSVMGQEIYWTTGITRVTPSTPEAITMYIMAVDYDFLPSYDLKVVAGRNFSKDLETDEHAVLLNEKAAEMFGFKNPQDAVNAKLRRWDTVNVVGVVSNYHQQGLQKAIDPMMFWLIPNIHRYYSLKMNTSDVQKTLASVEKSWNKYFPQDPFSYFFLDDSYNEQYKSDVRFGSVFALFATLAIIIACFGLLGLSAYNVLQRTKEIGIRKVLGATAQNLLVLLSREFIILVFASLFVAIPICWAIMHNWLQDFAYRIHISPWVFVLAGFLAVVIALVTVGLQALKASMANPVKNLRSE